MGNINWIAILVGALVPMIVGFIWYSPVAFGNAWMKSLGFTEEDVKKGNMPLIFGLSFVMSGLLAYLLSTYMGYHQPEDQNFVHGMFHGSYFAVLAAVPVLVSNSLFERKNWVNILINAAYWILTLALIGGVVTFFI